MIDIKDNPHIIELINGILNNKGICEVKVESKGVVVVEIQRTLRK